MSLIRHSQRANHKGCKGCGARIFWAHDTSRAAGFKFCERCNVTGKIVAVNGDDTRHTCAKYARKDNPADNGQATDDMKPIEAEVVYSVPVTPEVIAQPDDTANALAMLQKLLATLVDRDEITRIATEIATKVSTEIAGQLIDQTAFPTRTVVIKDQVRRPIEGNAHYQLEDVIISLSAGEHVMMVGPAGTGKSTIAEQAAEALGLRSFAISLSPQTPASQIIGYMQAQGEYVPSLFREAYESGGVFHFDEIDNAHPSVLAVINAALANGQMAFPDQMVKRHDDFRAVASANTYGKGATRAYVGRQAIDAATLDRFTVLTIEIDETLEAALLTATGVSDELHSRILATVRRMRQKAIEHGLSVVISPRASIGMGKLLAAGMSWRKAEDARLRRGLDDATWLKLTA